jgi:LytR cell envelope-related transcriptional attenuator
VTGVRRAETTRQRGQATPSVVAVVSVVAIVVALVAFFAGGSRDEVAQEASGDEATQGAAASASRSRTPAAPQTAARAPEQEKAAGADRSGRDTEAKQGGRDNKLAKRRPRPQVDTGPPDVYVEIYNNTSISGLAADKAAELQDAGWQVVGVDNWRGDIPASTVYYPAGFEAEAQDLAETIGVGRVRGAVAPMKFDRLTVILTPDAA